MDTTVDAFLNALSEALQARAGLSGVPVWTGDPDSSQAAFTEAIILGAGTNSATKPGAVMVTGDWKAIGRQSRQEEYTVPGEILAIEYGGGEAVLVAARQRGLALLAEVNTCLIDNQHLANVQSAQISEYTLFQGVAGTEGNGRGAYILFHISVVARLTRGA